MRRAEKRKVILSTNVAETSVTIDGVAAVIDSGLARLAGHSAWSGLPTLKIGKVSRASAAQRAGRAGRTRPGICLRLYTQSDHDNRPAFETPELLRSDLAEPLMAIKAAGVPMAAELSWLDPPPQEAVASAEALLRLLGASGEDGSLTDLGRRLLRFPLHPRLARLVVEAEKRGAAEEACELAALLGERDARLDRSTMRSGPSDPLEILEAAHGRRGARFERAARQLSRLCAPSQKRLSGAAIDEALQIALLAGFPDRVARRRRPGSDEFLLSAGGAATLARESVVRGAELIVAVEAEEQRQPGRPTGALIRQASAIEAAWLVDLLPDALREETDLRWNAEAERVEATWKLVYGEIAVEEERGGRGDPEKVAAVLAEAALAKGLRAFADPEELNRFVARVACAASWAPEAALPPLGEMELRAALQELCVGRRSFAELREVSLLDALRGKLSFEQQRLLAQVAPEQLLLPGGRKVRIEYAAGQAPWVESRLQDFCGLRQTPTVDRGRLSLVLHLLAPNKRAVQVTSDLAGFWERTYPAVRRELSRRYPRHQWPEDPRLPLPPRPPRRG